ncbi:MULTISPECIES: hypothetical protein [Paenibacillus]|uniref:hypothetical protein n=1 Tax=Paenibacillus TaxID=44249 RepID=UPI00096CC2A3|nr:hypothetical protein [Paenibacillus odorifer]OME10199.1 hypothetical protein BSK60_25610 [Paenibacillus odorifer]
MDKKISVENLKLTPQNDTYYIAWSIGVDKKYKKHMKKEIKSQLTDVLGSMTQNNAVEDISVYSHNKTAEKHGEFIIWDYLILMQIKEEEDAEIILPNLQNVNIPFVLETIRMELLVTTPNSTYPTPGEGARKRHVKPFYAIEYVDVQPNHLDEFRDIMINNNGPAMKYIMEEARWCHNFYALETLTVFYHNSSYPTWNQIHVIGLYLESIFLYKKDFSKGLALTQSISFEENFAQLKKIRTMLYKTIGRKMI